MMGGEEENRKNERLPGNELAFIGTGKEEKEEGVINQKVCKHIHK
jgi:hypothetical protein